MVSLRISIIKKNNIKEILRGKGSGNCGSYIQMDPTTAPPRVGYFSLLLGHFTKIERKILNLIHILIKLK